MFSIYLHYEKTFTNTLIHTFTTFIHTFECFFEHDEIFILYSAGTVDYTDGADVRPFQGQSAMKSEAHKSLVCG